MTKKRDVLVAIAAEAEAGTAAAEVVVVLDAAVCGTTETEGVGSCTTPGELCKTEAAGFDELETANTVVSGV